MSLEPVKRAVEEIMLDEIYVALKDSHDRLPNGTMLLKRCINYLEGVHGYQPPFTPKNKQEEL